MDKLPILAVSNAELARQPIVELGDRIICEACNDSHPLRASTANASLWFYECGGGRSFWAAIDGRLLPGLKLVGEGSAPTEGER